MKKLTYGLLLVLAGLTYNPVKSADNKTPETPIVTEFKEDIWYPSDEDLANYGSKDVL